MPSSKSRRVINIDSEGFTILIGLHSSMSSGNRNRTHVVVKEENRVITWILPNFARCEWCNCVAMVFVRMCRFFETV